MHKPLILLAIACVHLATAAAPAPAQVSPAQADAFRRDLRLVVDQSVSSIASMPQRRAHLAKLDELTTRAERLFGDALQPKFGSCVRAAQLVRDAWGDQMSLAGNPGGTRDSSLLFAKSFEAGASYWACREAVDALLPATPKECLAVVDLTKPNAPLPARPARCSKS